MPYVRFNGTKDEERGDFEEIVRYDDKAGAVGIVTELRAGLTEIDAETYAAEKAAILTHNAGLQIDQPPVIPPRQSGIQQIVTALIADPNLAPETKTALQEIGGGDVVVKAPLTPTKG